MGNSAKRDVRKADRAEMARQALILRRDGISYDAIGKQLGVSKAQAWRLVDGAIRDIPKEEAKPVLALELLRLESWDRRTEAAYKAISAKINKGDIEAVRAFVQLRRNLTQSQERRSAYLGLDAPKRSIQTDQELEAALIRLRDRLPAEEFARVVTILAEVQDVAGSPQVPGTDRGGSGGSGSA